MMKEADNRRWKDLFYIPLAENKNNEAVYVRQGIIKVRENKSIPFFFQLLVPPQNKKLQKKDHNNLLLSARLFDG